MYIAACQSVSYNEQKVTDKFYIHWPFGDIIYIQHSSFSRKPDILQSYSPILNRIFRKFLFKIF